MTLLIRPPFEPADYRAIAAILTAVYHRAVDPAQLQLNDRSVSPPVVRRMVAVWPDDLVAGISSVRPLSGMPAGTCELVLAVAPEQRRQGVGSMLYADAVAYAASHAVTGLVTTLHDRQPEALRFAQQRGFVLQQHWVTWRLQLAGFQEAPFVGLQAEQHARGIRCFSFADAPDTREAQRTLYDLNRRTSLDAPGEDSFPTFDEFERDILRAPWFRPDGQILAADGDRWIGLCAVGLDGPLAFNAFTGVDRAYRRRGIALALTLLAIRYARLHNATQLEVENDSRNLAMFELQARLGYERVPGRYIMQRSLA